jgi:hypothetical protein
LGSNPTPRASPATANSEARVPHRANFYAREVVLDGEAAAMAAPQTLTLKTNRDRQNWWQSVWIRRVLLVVPLILVVLGLADVFGQRPSSAKASDSAVRLVVTAPTHARSGLIYAARFRIWALKDIKEATLVLDPGWADGYTVNGEAPQHSPSHAGARCFYSFVTSRDR